MKRWSLLRSALIAAALVSQGMVYADTAQTGVYQAKVPLGSETALTQLYSYPNKPGSSESLADTIAHYTTQTAQRDGMPNLSVDVTKNGDQYSANITSSYYRVFDYQKRLPDFLAIGQKAVDATAQLKKDGKWDDKEWRMYLPLGLAMVDQRSVQLLHFPPDYSLPEQDYLGSKTSQRWESLLELNGVPASDVTLYEAIVDIAPIAAPASAGSTLEATYSYYAPYAHGMLEFLTKRQKGTARPVVAYGYPVRNWVQQQFGVSLQVLDTGTIKFSDGVSATIIGANHPSYIWYAKDKGFAVAETVMYQDLTAACWQATMGNNPDADPAKTVKSCDSSWHKRPTDVCMLTWEQAFDKSEQEAKTLCQSPQPKSLPRGIDMEKLERNAAPYLH